VPVPADFDGDGKTDMALFQPSASAPGSTDGATFTYRSASGNVISQRLGAPSLDLPVIGDFDGDEKTDFAVYRPRASSPTSNDGATWYALFSSGGGLVQPFGAPTLDLPLSSPFGGAHSDPVYGCGQSLPTGSPIKRPDRGRPGEASSRQSVISTVLCL
jgi:hypothetical protein